MTCLQYEMKISNLPNQKFRFLPTRFAIQCYKKENTHAVDKYNKFCQKYSFAKHLIKCLYFSNGMISIVEHRFFINLKNTILKDQQI